MMLQQWCLCVLGLLGADALSVARISSDDDTLTRWLMSQSDHQRRTIARSSDPHTECFGTNHMQSDAVIVMLVPPPRYVADWFQASQALKSLRLVQDNNRAEVRLFYDEDDGISSERMRLLAQIVGSRKVCATKIRYRQFPPGMSAASKSVWEERKGDNWGYLHMIRFFFVDLVDPRLNLLEGFKYWARLDTDAQFTHFVPDLFAEFDKHPDLGYIHNDDNADCDRLVAGLRHFTQTFVQLHGANLSSVKALDSRDDCVMGWYNNFEVGRIAAFQSPQALEFTKAVVDSEGIYKSRWGDALLRRIQVETVNITNELIDPKVALGYLHPGAEGLASQVHDAQTREKRVAIEAENRWGPNYLTAAAMLTARTPPMPKASVGAGAIVQHFFRIR